MRIFEVSSKTAIPKLLEEEDKEMIEEAKEAAKLIKRKCKPYLDQIDKKYTLYRGLGGHRPLTKDEFKIFFEKEIRTDRTIKDSSKRLTNSINEILKIHNSPVRRENSVFATGFSDQAMEFGRLFIIFPIGKFDFAWSDAISDPYLQFEENPRIGNYMIVDKEKKEKWKEKHIKEVEQDLKFKLKERIQSEIRKKWSDYFFKEVHNYINNLPDNDPDKYSDKYRNNLLNKWYKESEPKRNKELEKRLDKEYLSKNWYKRLETELENRWLEEYDHNVQYWLILDSERVIKDFAKTYNTTNLKEAIESGQEIMIKAKSYYAATPDFYEFFLKDELWP